MLYAIEMTLSGIIFLPSFVKMGTGVEEMIRFCLSNNLNGCNVGIFDGE
jgi:hypothetical protein